MNKTIKTIAKTVKRANRKINSKARLAERLLVSKQKVLINSFREELSKIKQGEQTHG